MNQAKKRKKSGAEGRKAKKLRLEEDAKMKNRMKNFLSKAKRKGEVGEGISQVRDAGVDRSSHEDESSLVEDGSGLVEDGSGVVEDGSGVVEDGSGLVEDGSGLVEDGSGLVEDESGVDEEGSGLEDGCGLVENGSDLVENVTGVVEDVSGVVEDGRSLVEDGNGLVEDESSVAEDGSFYKFEAEDDKNKLNSSAMNEKEGIVSIPTILGKDLSYENISRVLSQEPCHPSKEVLCKRKKVQHGLERYCSQTAFKHPDGSKRSWITYCLEKDALFCIPCILFSKPDENLPQNQSCPFTRDGYSNWHKHSERILKHEQSKSHIECKLAQVIFMQKQSIESLFEEQDRIQNERRKRIVEANREIMKRIIDTVMLLGKQELAFRGHRESLASEPDVNVGNFLEILKYLSGYDDVIEKHLDKVKTEHERIDAKLESKKKGDNGRKVGRGSKLSFMSKSIQNTLIDIISKEIVAEIVTLIENCLSWAVIADTTPDVARHEQLSLCVRTGEVSEHLLFCIRVDATTAEELLKSIAGELKRLEIPFTDLVAQTYDGASNMSGKYNGLQARFKEFAGEHVIFVHCYAHTLNLVLSDAATASLDIAKLFDNLQSVYVMFSKSQPVSELFIECQIEKGLEVHSLKRINTVRWSAREFCLNMFLKQYEGVMLTLEKVKEKREIDADRRSSADGLLKSFSTKQFLASAYLFKEIFNITGPLSRTLQGVNIDFGKALILLDTALKQLEDLKAEVIIENVENDFEEIEWEKKRVVRKKRMPGEKAKDDQPIDPEAKWRKDVFRVALDSVTSGLTDRFADSRHVLEAFTVFSPGSFQEFHKKFPTSKQVEEKVSEFCKTYKINSTLCANELFSFAAAFGRLMEKEILRPDNNTHETQETDSDLSSEDEFDEFENNANQKERKQKREKTFIDCLKLLTDQRYNLSDAYPTLVRVYGIAVAIPITSCSAERSFSTLKRVKTRLRSTMHQERLEGLLLMSIERKILLKIDKEKIIDKLAKTSKELERALK